MSDVEEPKLLAELSTGGKGGGGAEHRKEQKRNKEQRTKNKEQRTKKNKA